MSWGLIPEVFFDLIARIMPGSLFLVGALAVLSGPATFGETLGAFLPSVNLAALLLFGLFAYFAAIVLKVVWDFPVETIGGGTREAERSDPFLDLRIRMPVEASRLLKVQSEKSACEALVPGLGILFLGNLWMIAAQPAGDLAERVALGVVLLVAAVASWCWRRSLQRLFVRELAILQSLSKGEDPARSLGSSETG